jgi:hypothetical protein
MNFENIQLIGTIVLVCAGVIGALIGLVQLRAYLAEQPDPKLTYLTKSDFEQQFDHFCVDLESIERLVHVNAEQTAALSAQMQIILQRVHELSTKIDRLQEKTFA